MRKASPLAPFLLIAMLLDAQPVRANAFAYEAAVAQVVDANIAPAIQTEVISDPPQSAWSSTGTEMIATGSSVRVRSNIAYGFVGDSTVAGVELSVICTSGGTSCPHTSPATSVGEFTPFLSQTIDFGVPRVVDTTGWNVVVVYTFRPATL